MGRRPLHPQALIPSFPPPYRINASIRLPLLRLPLIENSKEALLVE